MKGEKHGYLQLDKFLTSVVVWQKEQTMDMWWGRKDNHRLLVQRIEGKCRISWCTANFCFFSFHGICFRAIVSVIIQLNYAMIMRVLWSLWFWFWFSWNNMKDIMYVSKSVGSPTCECMKICMGEDHCHCQVKEWCMCLWDIIHRDKPIADDRLNACLYIRIITWWSSTTDLTCIWKLFNPSLVVRVLQLILTMAE